VCVMRLTILAIAVMAVAALFTGLAVGVRSIRGPMFSFGEYVDLSFSSREAAVTDAQRTYVPGAMLETVIGSIPYWDQQAAAASFREYVEHIDAVVMYWYALHADGSVEPYPYAQEDPALVAFAHEHGVQVLALVANLPTEDEGGDWDAERVRRVLRSPETRAAHIQELLAVVQRGNFDGLVIDYEALEDDQREPFTQFIAELAGALAERGKVLNVALMPKDADTSRAYDNGSQALDYAALSRYADQLTLMTYEEHWETSEPGPVASTPWVRSILEYARTVIPSDKLYVGLPFYGYDWGNSPTAAGLTYAEVVDRIRRYTPQVRWDERAQSPHFTYNEDGEEHVVWFEDRRSLESKLRLFQSLGVRNVVIWRLGGEDPAFWDVLAETFSGPAQR
jgi:spore germination protein